MTTTVTALAHPNIAFIKYWGLKDESLRLPANDSLSMNIGCLSTRTTVTLDPNLAADTLTLNSKPTSGKALTRVQQFLDRVRRLPGASTFAHVESKNNFPIGAGIASSASGFAALALAATTVYDLTLPEKDLSSLARFGSGSACRSIPGGFVEWVTDPETGDSFARSIAPADHWQLIDCIAILSDQHKPVGSEAGMRLASTSPLQAARVLDAPRRMDLCRQAILARDFTALAQVTELDSNLMHAVMMTSEPPLYYWQAQTLEILKAVRDWRFSKDLPVAATVDAGPNVHILCLPEALPEILTRLRQFPGVKEVLRGTPAGPAHLLGVDSHSDPQKV
jgi:diphosphomevalonate decarboxylase